MKTPFRQGLIAYQRDGLGNPQYLLPSTTPDYVALNVSPTPTSVAIAHGSADYLLVFSQTVTAAWGPIPAGVTSHLYWDVDLLTSQVTFGFTTLEPVLSTLEPASPQVDQHWFDLNQMKMKVWQRGRWYDKVRAFAGKVPNGVITSLAPDDSEPFFAPWKNAVALQVEGNPGFIATDVFGNPIRTLAGEFVTTRTPVRFNSTVGTTGTLAVLPNAFIPVRASQNIPRMSLVYFSGEDTVGLASGNPATNPPRIPIGIVQEELFANEVGVVTQSGEITYDQWDWSADIGKPLYCGDNGEVITTRPNGLLAYRVGFVKNANTIVFQVDAETQPQIYQAAPNDIIVDGVIPISSSFSTNPLNERVWTVEIQPATDTQPGYMSAAQALLLTDVDTRLTQAELDIAGKADISHTHLIADVTGLQLVLDAKSDVGHTHAQYALTTHNHDLVYAPIVHSHTIPDVAGLQTELNGKANRVHVNTFDEVFDGVDRTGAVDIGTGDSLRTALGTKIDVVPTAVDGNLAAFTSGSIQDSGYSPSDFALALHSHAISDVTGLQLALDDKAPLVHSHAISDVTGLQLALDGKAAVVHTHAISDVTGLQLVLDGKAPLSHTHTAADITGGTAGFVLTSNGTNSYWSAPFVIGSIDQHTDVDTTTTSPATSDVLQWNGTHWVPAAVSGGSPAITLNEVAVGTGTGIGSSANLKYNSTTGEFTVNESNTVDNPAAVRVNGASASGLGSDTGGAVYIQAGNSPFGTSGYGGSVQISAGYSDATAGTVTITGGSAGPNDGLDGGQGGAVVINGGQSEWSSSAPGGHVVLLAGQQKLAADNLGKSGVIIAAGNDGEGGPSGMIFNGGGALGFSEHISSYQWEATVQGANYGNKYDVLQSNGQLGGVPAWIPPEFKPAPFEVVNTSNTTLIMGSAADHNRHLRVNAASTSTVQVKADSYWPDTSTYYGELPYTSPMPVGGTILFGKVGAGNVVFVADPGVTINTPETLTLSKLNGKVTLTKVGPNEWDLEGNLEPA